VLLERLIPVDVAHGAAVGVHPEALADDVLGPGHRERPAGEDVEHEGASQGPGVDGHVGGRDGRDDGPPALVLTVGKSGFSQGNLVDLDAIQVLHLEGFYEFVEELTDSSWFEGSSIADAPVYEQV